MSTKSTLRPRACRRRRSTIPRVLSRFLRSTATEHALSLGRREALHEGTGECAHDTQDEEHEVHPQSLGDEILGEKSIEACVRVRDEEVPCGVVQQESNDDRDDRQDRARPKCRCRESFGALESRHERARQRLLQGTDPAGPLRTLVDVTTTVCAM